MIRKISDKNFLGAENYNCAQAVLKTFQCEYKIDEQKIIDFKKAGGGKAENGLCGALYAAKNIADDKNFENIQSEFIKLAGSDKCREIRKLKRLTCRQCVIETASLIDKLKNNEADSI